MTSLVAIGNLALSHLGDDATISSIDPPEGSPQAEHIAQFLPIARDVLLEMHDWSFARTRSALAMLSDANEGQWQYSYARPADCIAIRRVLPSGYTDETRDAADFYAEGESVFTGWATASVVYTKRITDPNKWPPLFVSALSWLLASYIAGPMLKGSTGQAAGLQAYQVFLTEFARATRINANQGSGRQRDDTAPWITAR